MKGEMRNPHWIEREHLFDGTGYFCSRCGASFEEPWEECPACGVRMEKIKYAPVDVDEGEGAEKNRPDNRPALLRERMCSAEVFFV